MIELKNVSKQFGNKQALLNLSFSLKEDEILGLIGQNGAGKSTTFRTILNFIQPSSGEILWNNNKLTEKNYREISFMPEERGLYQKESIESQMIYFGALHGMKRAEVRHELKIWMDRLNVVGKMTDRVESLSKGNAQKVQLIVSMFAHPKLLILDEPFSGLDPVNVELLMNEVLRLRDEGTMIIFSDHNMANVEHISDKIIMLKNGKTVLDGRPDEIQKKYGRLELRIDGYKDIALLKQYKSVLECTIDNQGVANLKLANEEVGKLIYDKVVSTGYVPVFDQHYPSLDEIFRHEVNLG
ncbi:ATP-binding cassette domain-containing protein [Periweissella cryptocerci]|uniref:ATP-binding cassette domain-containing protein n=1 Tax=Periweissella cryptocerci TaxID=2506420 RepID=A0A4P6YTT2_9LACO|nr:ATP-binding cassette domain-containing protein [Periweissella cryptocerci]QBO36174.1 ATP-binding cassette domain-containing protein [Periweissella cryptocerci]